MEKMDIKEMSIEERIEYIEYWTMGLVVGMILFIIGVIGTIFLDDKIGIYPYFCMGAIVVMIVPSIIHLFRYHQYHQYPQNEIL